MVLYATKPGRRTGQAAADLAVVLWVVVWVRLGVLLHDVVARLSVPGRALEGAGQELTRGAERSVERVADLPLLGDRLAQPFEFFADGGRSLAQAGAAQQDAALTLALVLGLAAALPVAVVLVGYGWWRLRWINRASATLRLCGADGSEQLLALRALANRPLRKLLRATDDPYGAFASGDYAALAALELDHLGLRSR